jgi:hypothetical protein
MEIVGESAFVAFLAAIGYELYRWLQRGRLRYHRLLAVGDIRPAPRRPHLPILARLFLGAGFIFFFLWLVPTTAQADPLADEGLDVVAQTEELVGTEKVDGAVAAGKEAAEAGFDAVVEAPETVPPPVPEPVAELAPSVPEAPPAGGRPPLPSALERAAMAQPRQSAERDAAPEAIGDDRDRAGAPAAPRTQDLRHTTTIAEGDARSMTVGTSETLAPIPATFSGVEGTGADGAALGAEPLPSPSPGLGLMAAIFVVAVPGLLLIWFTSARHAQGFVRYLAAPPGPPG